jgi:glutaredoxin
MDLQVKTYSTPGCRACAALKQELSGSKYKEYITEVDLSKDAESMSLLSSKGIMSAPTLGVFYNGEFDYIIGMRPVSDVDDFIDEIVVE